MNRRNRTLHFILLAWATGSHMYTIATPAWQWGLLVAVFLIYPQIAYFIARRLPAERQRHAEVRNMLFDGFCFGLWSALTGFPLWLTFTFFMGVSTNLMIFASFKGYLKACGIFVFGMLMAQLLRPAPVQFETSLVTTALCMFTLCLFMLSVGRDAYLRATSLHSHRTQLRKQLYANQALQAQLSDQATKDPLTGLFNRRQLEIALQEVLRDAPSTHSQAALVLVDIDYFKEINDNHGHTAGDEVLLTVAQELQKSSRDCDLAIRYGGDEFLLIFKNITAKQALLRVEAICQRVSAIEFKTQGRSFFTTLSCGIALTPQDAKDKDSLIQCADIALYQAKNKGRNGASLYMSHLETELLAAK